MKFRRSDRLLSSAHVSAVAILGILSGATPLAQPAEPVPADAVPIQAASLAGNRFSVEPRFAREWRLNESGHVVWTSADAARSNPFATGAIPRSQPVKNRSKAYKAAQRVLAGVALGFVGFLGGGLVGAVIDGDCSCDSPGLAGFLIGAPVGAAVGATAGVLLVR